MRRDMDLIRKLVLKIEELTTGPNDLFIAKPSELGLAGYTDAEIQYHFDLMVEGGLIDTGGAIPFNNIRFRRLTVAGHDFVDSVRDDAIWAKTKSGALAAGGWSLDLLADLGKGFVRKKVADITGIEL